MDTKRNKVYILLGLAAVLWGAQPVVIKTLLCELSPTMITFYRYLAISFILFIVLFMNKGENFFPAARHRLTLLLMGVSGIALNNVLQFSGLEYSTVINCTLVSATTPAVTAVIAFIFLHEQVNRVQWIGIIISFLGVLFLVTHGSIEVIMRLSFNYGDVLFFASQVCWAVYTVLGRKVMLELSPIAATAWAGLAGALVTGIMALWEGGDINANLTANGGWSMLYIIIGGGVLAMTWWNSGVKVVGPSQAAIFTNIMPLVGMILAVAFLNEPLGWREVVGGLWILFGVYLTTQSDQIIRGHKRFAVSSEATHSR